MGVIDDLLKKTKEAARKNAKTRAAGKKKKKKASVNKKQEEQKKSFTQTRNIDRVRGSRKTTSAPSSKPEEEKKREASTAAWDNFGRSPEGSGLRESMRPVEEDKLNVDPVALQGNTGRTREELERVATQRELERNPIDDGRPARLPDPRRVNTNVKSLTYMPEARYASGGSGRTKEELDRRDSMNELARMTPEEWLKIQMDAAEERNKRKGVGPLAVPDPAIDNEFNFTNDGMRSEMAKNANAIIANWQYIPEDQQVQYATYLLQAYGVNDKTRDIVMGTFRSASAKDKLDMLEEAVYILGGGNSYVREMMDIVESDPTTAQGMQEKHYDDTHETISIRNEDGTYRDVEVYDPWAPQRETADRIAQKKEINDYRTYQDQQHLIDQYIDSGHYSISDALKAQTAAGVQSWLWDMYDSGAFWITGQLQNGQEGIEFTKPGDNIKTLRDEGIRAFLVGTVSNRLRDIYNFIGIPAALFSKAVLSPEDVNFIERQLFSVGGKWRDEIARQDRIYQSSDLDPASKFMVETIRGAVEMVPGIVAAVVATPAAGLAVFGAKAGGASARDAYEQGATLDEAVQYGLTVGTAEVVTEKLFMGFGFMGKGIIAPTLRKVIPEERILTGTTRRILEESGFMNSTSFRILKGVAASGGEATEEMIMEIASPYIKRATYDPEAMDATFKEVLYAGGLGAAIGGILGIPVMISNVANEANRKKAYDEIVDDFRNQKIAQLNEAVDAGYMTEDEAKATLNEINDTLNGVGSLNVSDVAPEEKVAGEALDTVYDSYEDAKKAMMQEARTKKDGEKITANYIDNGVVKTFSTTAKGGTLGLGRSTEAGKEYQRIAQAKNVTERSGYQLNVKEEIIKEVSSLSKAIGREVEFYRNDDATDHGYMDKKTGKIYINAGSSQSAARSVLDHVFTHQMENTAGWSKLVELMKKHYGSSYESRRQERIDAYEAFGKPLKIDKTRKTYDEADQELVAMFVEEKLLTDADTIREVVNTDKTLAQKIIAWINKVIQKLAGNKEQKMLVEARDLWNQALQEEQSGNKKAPKEGAGERHSFGGVNARTADLKALENAKDMLAKNHSAVDIFRETGWFVGADGKWRFEISNDDLELKIIGLVHRNKTSVLLDDLIESEKLFDAYPDLKWMNVELKNIEEGYVGQYDPNYDMINLSYDLFDNPDVLKDVLVHEIQHAIQRRESFAKGTSEEYWKMQIANGFDSRKKEDIKKEEDLQKEYEKYRKNNNELFNDVLDLIASTPDIPRGEINWETLESVEEDPVEWQEFDAKRDALVEKHGDKMFEFWDIVNKLDDVRKQGRTARELYLNTAGEIEARDAASRRKMTAEERRNRMPFVDNDAVIAKSDVSNVIKKDKHGVPFVEVTSDILNGVSKRDIPRVLAQIVKTKFNVWVDANGQKIGINKKTADEWRFSKNAKWLYRGDRKRFKDKIRSFDNADELLKASRNYIEEEAIHKNYESYARGEVNFRVDGRDYSADILVGIDKRNRAFLYDIVNIGTIKIEEAHTTLAENSADRRSGASSMDSITDSEEKSNKRFSIGKSTDAEYIEAVNRGDMTTAQRMVDEAAKAAGYGIKAYHGTRRADRVGNKFLPERATSGPMAFFTSDRQIAENYAKDKADTSLAYDEEYADYYSQFRVMRSGKSVKVQDLWKTMSFAEKQRVKNAGAHITFDEDGENIVWDENIEYGLGNWDAYTLNMHRGNAIEALIDSWLVDGNLYGRERDFVDVLKLAGIDNVEYRDPDARHEKVYDTYLSFKNPFSTDMVDDDFVQSFEEWYENQPVGMYERESNYADMWDKNNISADDFAERMRRDIENNSSNAWTSIPDSMTDYLKYLGYDGIYDVGGKYTGEIHTVYVPFDSNQIKSADPVTYDEEGNIIPLSERFNEESDDIRWSVGEKDAEYMDAVESGDMGTAQRLVREAANIAGFTSPKLHHGTKSFGFTQLRTKDLDIFEWSPFFATPDPNLAETYSGETERRQLRGGYPKATQDQIDEHLAEYYGVLKKRIRAIDNHLSKPALPRANDAKRRALIKDARNELANMVEAQDAKTLSEAYNRYLDAADALEKTAMLPAEEKLFEFDEIHEARWKIDRIISAENVFVNSEGKLLIDENREEIESDTAGIYSFYANLDGMLEIDGEGENWNHIDGSKIGKDKDVKTRDVALYAKENGYTGVIIRNIYDSGGQTDYYEPGDIYIFFEPASQVKSADPVTYDDNNEVIPLSERFNEENNDIRWSVGKAETARSYFVGDIVSYLNERGTVVERNNPKGGTLTYTLELDNGDRVEVTADELQVGVTPELHFDELPKEEQEAWHEPPEDWDMSRQIEDVYAEPITVSEFLELLYENGITVSKRTMNTWFRDHGFYEKRKKKNEKDRISEKGQKSGMFKKEGKDIMITEEGQKYFLQTFLHADKETVDDMLESGKIKLPTAKTDKKSPLEERAYVDMANEYEDEIFDTGIDYWWATLLTSKGVTYSKDYARNFDAAAQNNPEARKYLQKYFVRPLETAKADYASDVREKLESIKKKMAELGIQMDTEKASAVQWIGEGQYQDKYGDLHKYTLENLKEEFPNDWENIKKAEEFFREMYDQYLKDINQAREKIYPHPLEDAQDKMAAYEARRDRAAERIADQRAIIADIEKVLVAKKAELLKKKRTDTKVYANLQNSIRYNEERLARAKEHLDDYIDRKNKYDVLANEIRAAIDSGDILRNKRIIPRKDYFHHFQELSVGLGDVFSMSNNTSEIDPRLEGTSGYTEPRSKFSGVTLHRKHGRYKADAIEGMVRYVQTGEYMIHIDPVISEFRNHIVGMAKVTKDSRNANKLIRWLVQWTNDLAGKTNPADRFIQDVIGRETMKKIKWINSRAKANAVVGNLSSASAQFFNFPNLQAYVNDPKAYTAGLRDLLRFIRRDKDTRLLMRQSGFLNERYLDDAINALETKTKDKISHAAQWTLVVGDRYTSAMVWFTAYNDAVNKGKKRPIEYADDITRRCVAGRGIGEIPLIQKSNFTQIFAPFQIEVNNAYQLYKEKIVGAATGRTEKDKLVSAGQFGLILVMNFLMNTVTDLVLHRRVVYDPIYVFLQCLSDWKNGDDDEEEKNIAEKFAELLGRQAGEIISNIPYGSLLAYYGINWSWARENIFGDQDPTRFGVSNIALDWAAGFVESLFTGKDIVDDVLSFGTTFLMPFGGKQTERTLQGLIDSGILPELKIGWKEGISFGWKKAPGSYDKNGQLQFPLKSPISYDEDGKLQFGFDSVGDFGEWLSLLAFGKYATDEGQKYLGKDYEASTLLQNIFGFNKTKERTTLSERATEVVVTLAKNGSDVFEVYDTVRELQDAENIFEKRNILAEADLTDAEKAKILLGYVVSEDNYESTLAKMNGVISVGLGVDDYLKIANLYSLINDSEEYQTATEKTLLFNTELASMGYTSDQIQGVNEVMAYFSHIPADTSKFDELIGLGLSTDTTLAIQKTLGELEPLEGETQVSSLQKAEAIAGMGLSKDEETAAMAIALDDNTYVKYKVVTDYGVDAQTWVDFKNALAAVDAENNNNGSYDKEEKMAALDSLNVSNETRAALWQTMDNMMYSTEKDTSWKAARNPYSSSVGAKVVDACIEGKSALEASKETDEPESAYTSPVSGDIVINSEYGYRIHPISGEWKMHHGLDIDGKQGDPVFAAAEGTVVKTVNSNKGYGNHVIIEHADGTQTLYAHMYSYGVEEGQTVSQGEQIGEVGSTGGTTGPHLHFEVRVDGQSVNPQTIFDFTGEGIVTESDPNYAPIVSGGGSSGGGSSGGSSRSGSTASVGSHTSQVASNRRSGGLTLPSVGGSGGNGGGSRASTPVAGMSTSAPTFGARGLYLPKASDYTPNRRSISSSVATTQRTGRTGGSFWDDNILS